MKNWETRISSLYCSFWCSILEFAASFLDGGTTVDRQVVEEQSLTLRCDTGHSSTEDRGSGCPSLGTLTIMSGQGSAFLFSLQQQLLGQKEYEDNWLVTHRTKQVLCIYLIGFVFEVTVVRGLSKSSVASSSRICKILLHSCYNRCSWYRNYAKN